MELTLFLYTFSLALFFTFLIFKHSSKNQHHHLPPSPAPAIPVIGHLHLLKPPLHRTFHRFSQKHGPIFSLKLGTRCVVVVSSLKLVEECFTVNDVIFSNRPLGLVEKYIGYNQTTMAGAPYGQHWRKLRRLGAQEVFSSARLNAFSHIREDEASNLGDDRRVFEHAQSSNPEDFLPFLNMIDYRGLNKKLAVVGAKLDNFYQGLLEEHRLEKRNTIIGHLLSLQESDPDLYTDQTIKGFMTSMIIGGTDTDEVTVEWAMSVLLNHPQLLQNAKLELDLQVGHQRPQSMGRAHEFKPERFEGREVEPQTLLTFGMGRKACPGAGLGHRLVGLALGSLIQCFDWERVGLEEIDLTEGVGLTMPKLKPLEAMCRPREIMLKVLQESVDI
ncbi:hypothetical protein DH2020_040928 [Rehmannia glutinosa]|uniref:Uncharacterized protein n=1 Tax=Rehmannia glutinosa TaxID=99300 RepID=A0ABR0URM0_REHGL